MDPKKVAATKYTAIVVGWSSAILAGLYGIGRLVQHLYVLLTPLVNWNYVASGSAIAVVIAATWFTFYELEQEKDQLKGDKE